MNFLKKYAIYTLLLAGLFLAGCSEDGDVPEPENEEEVITDVTLIFTNIADAGDVVEASAQDPDGEGIQDLQILDEINLDVEKTYILTFKIMNNLDSPGEDIGIEIEDENADHQFFFGFTDNAFSDPTGNGNIDNSSDPVNYNDTDMNGNPVGLSTTWITSANPTTDGTFTVRLQHQPDIKTSTTGATDGDTDINLTFVLNIE